MISRNSILSLYKSAKLKSSKVDKNDLFLILERLRRGMFKKANAAVIVNESILKYSVSAYNYKTLHYLFNEIFINNEYQFFPETKSPLIVDCGANIGMASLYFKWIFPESTIIAFEPNPDSFFLMDKNIIENSLEKISYYNLGLSNKIGESPFYIENDNIGTLRGSMQKERGGQEELIVKTTTLSTYISKYENIDLVKMDVEGAEFEIVKELSTSGMMHKVKEFIIEYHHNMAGEMTSLSQFLNIFETEGYQYNIRTNYTKINSFQNILIHCYKKKIIKD